MITLQEEFVLVQLNGKVQGPFAVKTLRHMRGFHGHCLVSYPGSDKWAPAYRVLATIQTYEPPMAYTPDTSEPLIEWTPPTTAVSYFDWKADRIPGAWVDRWLKRIICLHVLLAIGAFAAWSFPAVRLPLQKELQRQWSEQELRLGPHPIRIVRYHSKPSRTV